MKGARSKIKPPRPHDHSKGAKRILALDVRPRSFGFVVFEGPNSLLDWGAKSFRTETNAVKIPTETKLLALLDEFTPSVVVIRKRETARSVKGTNILATIQRQAKGRGIRSDSFLTTPSKKLLRDLRTTNMKSHQL